MIGPVRQFQNTFFTATVRLAAWQVRNVDLASIDIGIATEEWPGKRANTGAIKFPPYPNPVSQACKIPSLYFPPHTVQASSAGTCTR